MIEADDRLFLGQITERVDQAIDSSANELWVQLQPAFHKALRQSLNYAMLVGQADNRASQETRLGMMRVFIKQLLESMR